MNDADKPRLLPIARQLQESGYGLCATLGTAKFLREHGVAVQIINKVREGRPNIVDAIKNGEIAMVINTVSGLAETVTDGHAIRRSALQQKVFLQTTLAGAEALAGSVEYLADSEVYSLQDLHQRLL